MSGGKLSRIHLRKVSEIGKGRILCCHFLSKGFCFFPVATITQESFDLAGDVLFYQFSQILRRMLGIHRDYHYNRRMGSSCQIISTVGHSAA